MTRTEADMTIFLDWLSQPATAARLRELAACGVRSVTVPGGAGVTLEAPPLPSPPRRELTDPERRDLVEQRELADLSDSLGMASVPYFDKVPT